ncbi:hypothetical protein HOLleu_23541 [Holothuria leucospilota]|uniref:Uncharacterized protein n=1 Tax=Holothuria leucospilota TaxID=206669 RepID=A0A9Q1BVJ5_HOLLE|nr:hypothetical protein HOLleu_23541 [Holothuria leucospilota]
MTSEESADSDLGLEGIKAKEGSAFPIWWAFLIFPVIILGLVALVLFGIWRRKMVDRRTKPMAKEKENVYTEGISIQSDENEDRESSNEGAIYNPVYGNNEIDDDPKTTPNGQQSFAAGVYYGEIRKGESINGEMIYNSAYEGLSLKGDDAMLTDAAYATVSEINSKKRPSHNKSHKVEQNSQEVAGNETRHASKKSILRENIVVYETVDETEEGNKDRESKVEMIYNSAYANIPSNEKRDFKRDGDYSVVEGINSGEGSLYSRIDDKGKESPKNVAVNGGKA